jgi:DNA-directed RNA polymerase specialized sigma24 family protein
LVVPSDEELLLAAQNGDGDAFATFYRRHAAAVTGFHRRRVAMPEVAFDLTAETFASLVAALDSFDPARGSARGWLSRSRSTSCDRRCGASRSRTALAVSCSWSRSSWTTVRSS